MAGASVKVGLDLLRHLETLWVEQKQEKEESTYSYSTCELANLVAPPRANCTLLQFLQIKSKSL